MSSAPSGSGGGTRWRSPRDRAEEVLKRIGATGSAAHDLRIFLAEAFWSAEQQGMVRGADVALTVARELQQVGSEVGHSAWLAYTRLVDKEGEINRVARAYKAEADAAVAAETTDEEVPL